MNASVALGWRALRSGHVKTPLPAPPRNGEGRKTSPLLPALLPALPASGRGRGRGFGTACKQCPLAAVIAPGDNERRRLGPHETSAVQFSRDPEPETVESPLGK